MGTCISCGTESPLISQSLALCASCIRQKGGVHPHITRVHEQVRKDLNLPVTPARASGGKACRICMNQCSFEEGTAGYCGIRSVAGGRLRGASVRDGKVSWYHDQLPTNCVADWVCPGGSHAGYPAFSHADGPETGFKNLAVFYYGCTMNCLFCQNWQHKKIPPGLGVSPGTIVDAIDETTSCVCFFGGDPTPQLPHALSVSRLAAKRQQRILRFCWETNGTMHPALLEEMVDVSLESGGCIKFDLKTWNEDLSYALCGQSNQQTLANFERLAPLCSLRPDPPLVVASTLLVPGYVDHEEVYAIASFIAKLSPDIPYSLLAFHPDFLMNDLPTTPRDHVDRCLDAAQRAGLRSINVGNPHLFV